MKLSLTITAETEADNAKVVEVASQFGGTAKVEKPATAPVKTEKTEKTEKPAKEETKVEKTVKGKKVDKGVPEITIKEVRKVFTRLLDTLGDDDGPVAGRKILKKYNAKDIPSVSPEHYQALIDDAESLIRESQNTKDADEDTEDDGDDFGIGSDDDGDDE